MYKPESVQENETHQIILDFQKTDHQIPSGRPDWEKVYKKKRTCRLVDFARWKFEKEKMKREISA